MNNNTKWVACWGNATSITDRREATYAKNLTLRYPIRMCFSGSQLRFRFSNLTGTEPVVLSKVFADHTPITFGGENSVTLMPGKEVESDAISHAVSRGDMVNVSFYLADFTQMNSGTLITGPLSKGFYAYGDYAEADELPLDLTRRTNWFYFLNTIDILTSEDNHAIVCFGDSITAQSWPDYMAQMAFGTNAAIIRRAVSGTRILRQYDCITYQAYGLKGATRFPIEMNVAGATDVIIQHGINDIIHPVGTDVNPFRPWSDLPTVQEMQQGVEDIYVKPAKAMEEATIKAIPCNIHVLFIQYYIPKKRFIPLQQLYTFSVKTMRFEISISIFWLMLKESNQFRCWYTFDGHNIIPIRNGRK